MAKNCNLIWVEGHLTCTVNHRDYRVCDLSEGEEVKIGKVVKAYIEPQIPLIADGRNKVVRAGGRPNVMYIGDLMPRNKNKLQLSPMKVDTGCRIFGMKIVMDFRIPKDSWYIMQGEL